MPGWLSLRRIIVCVAAVATLLAVVHSLTAFPRPSNRGFAGNANDDMGLNTGDAAAGGDTKPRVRFTYTTVAGVFLQSEASTIADGFDYATSNFGLISRAYPTDDAADDGQTQWQRFAKYVMALNEAARDAEGTTRVAYKVLFMGRHGEGDHNVAEAEYGTAAWNCYWAQQDGNGSVAWADAHLTPTGEAQAAKANRFWAGQLVDEKQPAPQRFYVSPLTRCLQTASITFGSGLALPLQFQFRPIVKEYLREDVSTHTCDRRASRTALHAAFPVAMFEDGFAEEDPLWTGTTDETPAANDVRSWALLDDIFSSTTHDDDDDDNDATWLSFTSHSGEITSLLRVLGHRPFPLSTGQIIPVLVRAETVPDDDKTPPPPPTNTEWAKADTCKAPPITSVADQGDTEYKRS
ncbi:putative phosphoglycerate mutase pmu1 [Sporothrix curviconia]|uniref:Phosphoglycerate mutase pmu1 n=1 Tax=Sporothrix curviconia TaxID=1260050 RepID=A0ABP0BC38_9PEZI